MSRIRVKCACSAILLVKASRAGTKAKCPRCERPFEVPTPEPALEEPEVIFAEAPILKHTISSSRQRTKSRKTHLQLIPLYWQS
ncbi:MAG: hypothetical protein CMJ78_07495 [Planctomycetaceae bacterium]|nr:hypothetical protein [Planctomycetaceae bacterium]